MLIFWILIFFASCGVLYFASEWIIKSVIRIAEFLRWREFVVAFFIIAFAAALPNLFVGISSIRKGVPELAFGDIMGNNLLVLTIAPFLAVIFSKKSLPAASRTVQTTSIFTMVAAILPLLLILDGEISRLDGVLLLLFYAFYVAWLFSKEERFTKVFDRDQIPPAREFKLFLKACFVTVLGMFLLFFAAEGIVSSAIFFAEAFNFPLFVIGILIVGFGSCVGEFYFTISLARKKETWMILGNLMGTVVANSALILGLVALISPIRIENRLPFMGTILFLFVAATLFFAFIKTDKKIEKKEAMLLLSLYLIFVFYLLFIQSHNY